MQRFVINVLLFVIFTLTRVHSDYINEDGKDVAEATKYFPLNLHHATRHGVGGNFVISPFSIGSVLSMLREGANGLTRQELNEVMRFDGLNDDQISNGYYDITFSLHENRNAFVKISNRIYIANTGKINTDFTDILEQKYFTKVLPTNFARSQEVADDINAWVDKSTEGKIKDLITSDAIQPDMKALVVNAIYFNGTWKNPFTVRATTTDVFENEDGNSTKTHFMYQDDFFPYVEMEEVMASAISMPYEGNRFSLIVILPNIGTSLKQVEEELKGSSIALSDIPDKMARKSLAVMFPKFRMETEVDFTKTGVLRRMGLKDAISPGKADFTRISAGTRLHIDTVIQKSFIDITEFGTEAAGATYAKVVPFSIRRSIPFHVKKPFLAYIYDAVTKSVLFTVRKSSV